MQIFLIAFYGYRYRQELENIIKKRSEKEEPRSEVEPHLDILLHEPALGVEPPQLRGAVQYDLVAAPPPRVLHEPSNDALPEPPAARGGVHHHVLDMPHAAAAPDELALHEHRARGGEAARGGVLRDEDEVVGAEGRELLEAGAEGFLGEGCGRGELGEEVAETLGEVRELERPDAVPVGVDARRLLHWRVGFFF